MKAFGKEINPASINLWMNVISFVIGIWFYFKIAHNTEHQKELAPINHSYDSLIMIATKLDYQIKELKSVQETLITKITQEKNKLTEQTTEVNVHRQHIHSIINSDWNSLNKEQQDVYINKLMSNLKQPTP